MTNSAPLAIVAGAGAGLGQSLLSRFEAEGMTAVGLGRTRPSDPVGAFHKIDLADADAVSSLIADLIGHYGPPKGSVSKKYAKVI